MGGGGYENKADGWYGSVMGGAFNTSSTGECGVLVGGDSEFNSTDLCDIWFRELVALVGSGGPSCAGGLGVG